jgi:hypothetical protein
MNLDYGAASIRDHGSSRTTTYTEIRHPVSKRGACPVCGKKRTRSGMLTQTMSPFNRDPESGAPRTDRQIRAALAVEAEGWVPDFSCQTHEPAEVCAMVGHKPPGRWGPEGQCPYCRAML